MYLLNMLTISAIWGCHLYLTDKKVGRVLVFSSIFYYLKKWIKETAQEHLKC